MVIVNDYIEQCRTLASSELRFFRTRPNLQEALRLAALARTQWDTRHDHQRRISQHNLEQWRQALAGRIEGIRRCESFQELFGLIENVGNGTRGIGELAIYDTAQRLGAYIGFSPEVVYLHRGTRKGARMIGLGRGQKYLRMDELPSAFSRLKPYEVEDCLCIYKDDLMRLKSSRRTSNSRT